MSRLRAQARTDPAARWRAAAPTLAVRLGARATLIDLLRAINGAAGPAAVADAIVARLGRRLPLPGWAVVATGPDGAVSRLAEFGLHADLGPAADAVGEWVIRHGEEFVTPDLREDPRVSDTSSATVAAFPLQGRERPVGALVGLAGTPSARPLRPGRRLGAVMTTLLEPAGAALDHALQRERLEALSVTDDLTQLYNSRYLNAALRRETKRAARSQQPLSLLFLDLDGFKGVNDRHGHLCGSRTLVEVADVIRGSARETDIAARFGGDEFAVILPDTHAQGAMAVGERIRGRISAQRFLESDGLSVHVTASVGVATLPDVALSADALLRAADAAMYVVKGAGKDGVRAARRDDDLEGLAPVPAGPSSTSGGPMAR